MLLESPVRKCQQCLLVNSFSRHCICTNFILVLFLKYTSTSCSSKFNICINRRYTRKQFKQNDIPRRGIEPRPRRWERRILTTRPPGTSYLTSGMQRKLGQCTYWLLSGGHTPDCCNWKGCKLQLQYSCDYYLNRLLISLRQAEKLSPMQLITITSFK